MSSSVKPRAGGVRPHDGQRDGEAGDAAPGEIEAAFVEALHLGRAGRVVGDDHVDDAFAQTLPERFAVGAAADGRRALEQRRAVGNLFRGKVQIVRAGLDRDRQAFRAGGLQVRQVPARWRDGRCVAGSDTVGRARSSGGWLRARLRRGARRGRWHTCASLRRAALSADGCVDGPGEFGVDEQRQAGLGDGGQRALQLLAVDHGEAVAAGIDEEALEAGDAGAGERQDVRPGCRRRRRPRRPSPPCTGPAAACALGFERGDGGGFGQAVQRHVDERGVAAGGGGAGAGGEALPLGAAGLVDVDVACRRGRAAWRAAPKSVDAVSPAGSSSGCADGADASARGPSSSSSAARRMPCGVTTRSATNACAIIAIIRYENVSIRVNSLSRRTYCERGGQPSKAIPTLCSRRSHWPRRMSRRTGAARSARWWCAMAR